MSNSELNILKNFIDMMPKIYRARHDNAAVVFQILLNRTSTAGRTSCIAKCRELGIDPYGHTLKQSGEQKNNGWIPVSKELPAKDRSAVRILVTLKNEFVCEAFYINSEFKYVDGPKMKEFFEDNPVIAWQPLPEPYKEAISNERA